MKKRIAEIPGIAGALPELETMGQDYKGSRNFYFSEEVLARELDPNECAEIEVEKAKATLDEIFYSTLGQDFETCALLSNAVIQALSTAGVIRWRAKEEK